MPALNEKFIVDNKGKKSAVILPIEQYNNLMEDIHDLTKIAERKSDDTISLKELRKKLK